MAFAWKAYSKPCPSDAGEMFTLIVLCVLVSCAISALLFAWMVFSLAFDHFVASITAAVCVCVMVLLLILVHPVRCVVTVTVPSLGTKQGRKILLSSALLYAISSCVPNITHNVGLSLHMLKCSTGNITQTVLASSNVPVQALKDIKEKVNSMPTIQSSDYSLELESNVDMTGMKQRLFKASENVRTELAFLHRRIGQISQIVKKIFAGLFILLMIGSSVAYVNGYLTYIKYDNVYQSRQLTEALQRVSGDVTLPKSYQKKLVKTTGVWMSTRELKRGLWGALSLFVYAFMCGLILGLDHLVYESLNSLLAWTSNFPDIEATVYISMTLTSIVPVLQWINPNNGMYKQYPYTVRMLPPGCVQSLSAPESSTLTSISVSFAIAVFMLLVEVFACRLRRKVCASFYSSREEQRTQFLLHKILEKRQKPVGNDD
ncbi:osteoclast stimulatory transmembrane protein-like [Hoplias malabaricus]|uniref:osteoclast stimulatory transmembrane protein-like n=1 Tax=Hoplias malabaricus TaxID=27720 RepID=UPI003462D0DA